MTAIPNLTPALREFTQFGTEQMEKLANAVKEKGIAGGFEMLSAVVGNTVEEINSMLPSIVKSATDTFKAFVKGIRNHAKEIGSGFSQVLVTLADAPVEILPDMIDGGMQIAASLANGLTKAVPKITEQIPKLVKHITRAIKNNAKALKEAGKSLLESVFTSIEDNKSELDNAFNQLYDGVIVPAFDDLFINLPAYLSEKIGGIDTSEISGAVSKMIGKLNISGAVDSAGSLFQSVFTKAGEFLGSKDMDIAGIISSEVKTEERSSQVLATIQVSSEYITTETTKSADTMTTTTIAETINPSTTKTTTITTKNEGKSGEIYLNNLVGAVGETVHMPIGIQDNPGVISLLIEISFDNSALQLVSVNKNSECWESATMTPGGDLTAQPYRIIWYDGLAKNDFTKDGILAGLSFKILRAGSHKIELTFSGNDTFNSELISVPFGVSNGIIDVSSEFITTTVSTSTIITDVTTTTSSSTTITTTEGTTVSTETTQSSPTNENVTKELLGDVNRDEAVNASDAAAILVESAQIGAGISASFTAEQSFLADINNDGKVDASDAASILIYAAEVGAGAFTGTMEEFINSI